MHKILLLQLFPLLLLSCSEINNSTKDSAPKIKTNSTKEIKKVNYNYIERIDESWESISNGGSLKTNKINIPKCELIEQEIKFDASILAIIKEETKRQVDKLVTIYSSEGMSKNPTTKLVNQTAYKFGSATLARFEHSVDFEYTNIITFLIIDSNTRQLYSKANKLGLELELKCVQKNDDTYQIYGNLKPNPEFNCGGDFKLTFKEDNRIMKYAFCEENG